MLITAIFWIYVFTVVYLYGWYANRMLSVVFQNPAKLSLLLTWLLGLVLLTTTASFFSLFMPIGAWFHLLVILGTVLILIYFFKTGKLSLSAFLEVAKKPHWLTLIIGGLSILTLLEVSTRIPSNPDSGQYHAQAIRWIESFGVVPGLGNLLTRYAFNSSWFVSNAVFSFAFLGRGSFHLLPSLLFLLVVLSSLSSLDSLLKRDVRLSIFFRALLLPFAFNFLASEASSPGTDIPITLISWILLTEWLRIMEAKGEDQKITATVIWVIAVFCITIKLSAAIWLLGGLFVLLLVDESNNRKFLVVNFFLGVFILAPWVARNIILSGYLVYPFPFLDILRVDWKIPLANAISDVNSIQNWAKLSGKGYSFQGHLPLDIWFPDWLNHQTLVQKGILGILVICPIILTSFIIIPWKGGVFLKGFFRQYFPVYIFLYIGGLFWFFTSPALRFGYGFILSAFILVLLTFVFMIMNFWPRVKSYIGYLLTGFLILYQIYILVFSVELRTLPERLVFPADYRELPTEPCKLKNTTVLQPSSEAWMECWYSPFPCTPHCEPGVEQRGETLHDGFRWENSGE